MPNNRVINFNEPYISGDEEKYIKDVFERNSFYGNGVLHSRVPENN